MKYIHDRGPVSVCILTGGSGVRCRESGPAGAPKQFIAVQGKPVFIHALEIYLDMEETDVVYLVANAAYRDLYANMLDRWGYERRVTLVDGGRTRLQSVLNAAAHIRGEGMTVIHNGASILTRRETVRNCMEQAHEHGAATGWIPAFHTVFESAGDTVGSVLDRRRLGYTCDPQVLRNDVLRASMGIARRLGTDDAPVVDMVIRAGYSVRLVESGFENLKITTPADIRYVESVLALRQTNEVRYAETMV